MYRIVLRRPFLLDLFPLNLNGTVASSFFVCGSYAADLFERLNKETKLLSICVYRDYHVLILIFFLVEFEAKSLDVEVLKVVPNISDHLCIRKPPTTPNSDKILQDYELMKGSLEPGTYVRASYPDRADLVCVMILGTGGTPYHDCPVFFHLQLPSNFPLSPPNVYDSHLLTRPFPILTWEEVIDRIKHGNNHTYDHLSKRAVNIPNSHPKEYNLIVMIDYLKKCLMQGKIGPGSNHFNTNEYLRSRKQMLQVLDKPPQHFEDIVYNHFFRRGDEILEEFKAYGFNILKDPTDEEDQAAMDLFEAHKLRMLKLLDAAFKKNKLKMMVQIKTEII